MKGSTVAKQDGSRLPTRCILFWLFTIEKTIGIYLDLNSTKYLRVPAKEVTFGVYTAVVRKGPTDVMAAFEFFDFVWDAASADEVDLDRGQNLLNGKYYLYT